MAPGNRKNPSLWLIAGPNGSGKSSLYGSEQNAIYGDTNIADSAHSFWIINPDLLTLRICSVEGKNLEEANLEAVRRIEAWLWASVDAHQSVGVETVLSTDKYRPLVLKAKERGFEIRLVYVILQSPEFNIKRVRMRVAKGGHDVPADRIAKRWKRSLEQFPWFLDQADWALLFDNSEELRLVGRKADGAVTLDPASPGVMKDAVAKIGTKIGIQAKR
jgi:predicted ABC-type ATPase